MIPYLSEDKKVFFACLDISLDELFSENEYQKIYI